MHRIGVVRSNSKPVLFDLQLCIWHIFTISLISFAMQCPTFFFQLDLYEPHFAGVRSNSPRVQSDLLCARLKSSPQTDLKNIRSSRMSENLSSWPQSLAMFHKCSLFVNAGSVQQYDRCLSLSEQQVSCSLSNASFSNDPPPASAVTTRTTNWLMAYRPAGDLIVIDFSFIYTSLSIDLDVLEKLLQWSNFSVGQ